jgi:hypothetical protein
LKKYLTISGWILVGILIQFQLDPLYRIVVLENLGFHERTYKIKMNLASTPESLRVLHVETSVNFSLGPDYFANVYIPVQYKVLNRSPNLRAEAIAGYKAYQIDMMRKYRHVQARTDFIIVPQNIDESVQQLPILVHFENMKQRLHVDKTYLLSTLNKITRLDGPEMVEAKYPQQVGL